MIANVFAGVVGNVLAGLPTRECTEFLFTLLSNRRAATFAAQKLRAKYADAVRPASYDSVVANFCLTRQDFIDYFQAERHPTIESLSAHLKGQLRVRASAWVHNRPSETVFAEMVDDFYQMYANYFVTVDPGLLGLHLIGATNEISHHVQELRSAIVRLGEQLSRDEDTGELSEELRTLLTVSQLPYEVLEDTQSHIDLTFTETSGAFPVKIFLSGIASAETVAAVEDIHKRAAHYGGFNQFIVVTHKDVSDEVATAAARRGIDIQTLRRFAVRMQTLVTSETYVIGSVATSMLWESLAIDGLFVDPHCVGLTSDMMFKQDRSYAKRESALTAVRSFVEDSTSKLLALLGGYGSGKTALCASLLSYLPGQDPTIQPVYVALNRLREAEGISRVVAKADAIARSIAGPTCTVVVILDGLDELPNAMRPLEKRNNVLRIIEGSHHTDKLVVTARTTYFRGVSDLWALFSREGESPLWERMLQSLPRQHRRPELSVLVLQDFNNDQINTYVTSFSKRRACGQEFESALLNSLATKDKLGIYRRLCRCPLFLFLLVNTQPWNDASVKCIGDVIHTLMRYWLERDIEKGASRWQFTTSDRMQFVDELAWWMSKKDKLVLSFDEYDEFIASVGRFKHLPHDELSLDLQTTGFFSSFANKMHFALQEFMDYLVACRFAHGALDEQHPWLPRGNAIKMLLGFMETGNISYQWRRGERYADSILNSLNLDLRAYDTPIDVDPEGIIAHNVGKEWTWPHANSDQCYGLRLIVNAALDPRGIGGPPFLTLLISNAYGIHARPAMRVVEAAVKCPSELQLRHDGLTVDAKGIISVMRLAATGGSIIQILHEVGHEEDAVRFLEEIGAVKAPFGSPWQWECNFVEVY